MLPKCHFKRKVKSLYVNAHAVFAVNFDLLLQITMLIFSNANYLLKQNTGNAYLHGQEGDGATMTTLTQTVNNHHASVMRQK